MPSLNVPATSVLRMLRVVMVIGFLASAVQHADSDCNLEFVSRGELQLNGTFNSPNYPLPHPVDVTCRYVFQGQGEERVQIIFTDIDLNDPRPLTSASTTNQTCDEVDSVTVTVYINGLPRDIGVYCGKRRAPMLMSNGQVMEVTFVSRTSPSQAKGFKAEYKFVKDFGIKSGKKTKDLTCGFVFLSETAPNGTFTSPNFPGLYPRNTECHYLFYGTNNNEIVYITFPYFDVEGVPPRCAEDSQSDYVEFSNFNVLLVDRKMNRLCGVKSANVKNSVNSDGNFFRVTFKSNDAYDATGFEAFYQFRRTDDPYSQSKVTRQSNSAGQLAPPVAALLLYLLASSHLISIWRHTKCACLRLCFSALVTHA